MIIDSIIEYHSTTLRRAIDKTRVGRPSYHMENSLTHVSYVEWHRQPLNNLSSYSTYYICLVSWHNGSCHRTALRNISIRSICREILIDLITIHLYIWRNITLKRSWELRTCRSKINHTKVRDLISFQKLQNMCVNIICHQFSKHNFLLSGL